MAVKDFILDDDMDLSIKGGDFEVGESSLQHQQALLLSEKGEYKQSPNTGVGITSYINGDNDADDLQTNIQKEFEADGIKISELKINAIDNITIKADYGS